MLTTGSQEPEVDIPREAASVSPKPAGVQPRSFFARWTVAGILCLVLAGLIYSDIRSRKHAAASLAHETSESQVPTVSIVHPQPGSQSDHLVLPGDTQAYIDTPIYARTSGYLKDWYTDIGAHVHKGQLLAIIEAPELDQQLDQARADLKNAQANLQLAQITATRMTNLIKENAVSQQETDQAVADLAARRAAVTGAQANVGRLEQLQSFERIVAPFDGVITARNIDIGALIQAGDPANSKELFHLASIRKLRVYIAVPEVNAREVRNGERVSLTLDTFPGKEFTGNVVRNSNAIDRTSRTLNVEVDVDNPDGVLMPGAYASVRIPIHTNAGSVTIPANALLFRSQGLQVAVVREGRIQLVPITIGHDYGSTVEVISGLKPDDAVITNPSDSIESGTPVRIAKGPHS